jgi:hypothetical protein
MAGPVLARTSFFGYSGSFDREFLYRWKRVRISILTGVIHDKRLKGAIPGVLWSI